jgi:hypothetical protein
MRVAAEHDQQRPPQHAEDQDAVREGETIALVHELARQEAVAREDRRESWKVRVGGVRRKHEDRHRRRLDEVVRPAAAAERRPRDL